METVTIPKEEYDVMKKEIIILKRSIPNVELLLKLINGLEDIKYGRVKPWKKQQTNSY